MVSLFYFSGCMRLDIYAFVWQVLDLGSLRFWDWGLVRCGMCARRRRWSGWYGLPGRRGSGKNRLELRGALDRSLAKVWI